MNRSHFNHKLGSPGAMRQEPPLSPPDEPQCPTCGESYRPCPCEKEEGVQDRFQELWNLMEKGKATPLERREFFKLQVDYWLRRERARLSAKLRELVGERVTP